MRREMNDDMDEVEELPVEEAIGHRRRQRSMPMPGASTSTVMLPLSVLPSSGRGFRARVCATPVRLPRADGQIELQLQLASPVPFVEVVMPGMAQLLRFPSDANNRQLVRVRVSRDVFDKTGHLDLELHATVRIVSARLVLTGMLVPFAARPCVAGASATQQPSSGPSMTGTTSTHQPYQPYQAHRHLVFFFPPLGIFLLVLLVLTLVRCCCACCRRRCPRAQQAQAQQTEQQPPRAAHTVFSVPPPPPHVHLYAPVPMQPVPAQYEAKPLSVYPAHY